MDHASEGPDGGGRWPWLYLRHAVSRPSADLSVYVEFFKRYIYQTVEPSRLLLLRMMRDLEALYVEVSSIFGGTVYYSKIMVLNWKMRFTI